MIANWCYVNNPTKLYRCSLNTTEELMEQSVRGLDGLISSLNKVGYDDKDMIEVRTALTNS